eukprot:3265602-Alexandrium_andersonii.AAC.1
MGYCVDPDGALKVAISTGRSTRESQRRFTLFQCIRKAIHELEGGMRAALAERYVPDAARDLR